MQLLTSASDISPEEREQILQTIEMFEVITQANPQDCQSMEILKDAYQRVGKTAEFFAIARKLGDTYAELGQYSAAMLEYEGILKNAPDSPEVVAALVGAGDAAGQFMELGFGSSAGGGWDRGTGAGGGRGGGPIWVYPHMWVYPPLRGYAPHYVGVYPHCGGITPTMGEDLYIPALAVYPPNVGTSPQLGHPHYVGIPHHGSTPRFQCLCVCFIPQTIKQNKT